MTVRDLMTMTSGLACDDNDEASPGKEDTMQDQKEQPDWYKYTLDLPMARNPGGDKAIYCSAGINLPKEEPSAQIPWTKTMLGLVCLGTVIPQSKSLTARRGLRLKEPAEQGGPLLLKITIALEPARQQSLDSLLRFGPRQRGLEGVESVEEMVGGW